MGRGRKGLLDQRESSKKEIRGLRVRIREPEGYFISPPRTEMKKIMISEDVLEFMKGMNSQQLADFLLQEKTGSN